MTKKSKIEKIINIVILIVCVLLGTAISIWTTGVQGSFLNELGVSRWGAMTIEPLLIMTSFILGTQGSKVHKFIAGSFLIILFGISLITMVSMYTKKSYTVLEQTQVNEQISKRSTVTEDSIRKTLEKLSERDSTSSKNLVKIIDQLNRQQEKTEKKSETLELKSIIDVISSMLHIDQKKSILLFAFFISLAGVFSPSFLFFTAGIMIRNTGAWSAVADQIARMQGLSLKQKVILLGYENVSDNISELAKFLGTSEKVIKIQLSRIGKKGIGLEREEQKKEEISQQQPIKRKRKRRKLITEAI